MTSQLRHAFGQDPQGYPKGGLDLGAEPELPEGLRVFQKDVAAEARGEIALCSMGKNTLQSRRMRGKRVIH